MYASTHVLLYMCTNTGGPKTKRPKGQNVPRQNILRHKVPRTKHPKRQNVPRTKCPKDKTSQGTKRPKEKKILHLNFQYFKNRFCPNFFENGPHMLDITILGRLGHIGLGNGPHMYEYSMLGNELNLWIGLFLLRGG